LPARCMQALPGRRRKAAPTESAEPNTVTRELERTLSARLRIRFYFRDFDLFQSHLLRISRQDLIEVGAEGRVLVYSH
jgi:hypothetical protein